MPAGYRLTQQGINSKEQIHNLAYCHAKYVNKFRGDCTSQLFSFYIRVHRVSQYFCVANSNQCITTRIVTTHMHITFQSLQKAIHRLGMHYLTEPSQAPRSMALCHQKE